MIYRGNLALQPSAVSRAALAAHLVCEAVIRHFAEEQEPERFRSLLALHELDARSSSEILQIVTGRAETVAAVLRGAGVDIAPTGSGRSHAKDNGGRIASALEPWIGSLKSELALGVHPRNRLSPIGRDLGLWDLAHPEFARAIACAMAIAARPYPLTQPREAEDQIAAEAFGAALAMGDIREVSQETAEPADRARRW